MRRHKSSHAHARRPKTGLTFIWKTLGWAALCLFVAAGLLFIHPWSSSRLAHARQFLPFRPAPPPFGVHFQVLDQPAASAGSAGRYSVIPGGVHSKKQLARVLATDPVVARHYANFDLHNLRFFRLRHGRDAYVSYRLGNLIFWTSRKIRLFAGETLLTDGVHLARARCGNRVSFSPKQPTTSWQPSDLALSTPILHLTPVSPILPPLSGPGTYVLTADGSRPATGVLPFFPIFFIPPGGGPGGTPVTPATPPPPLPTPEPATFVLFASGLAILGAKYLWRVRQH